MKRVANAALVGLCAVMMTVVVGCHPTAKSKAIRVQQTAMANGGGQRWALVIGINEYAGVPELRFARNDAAELADTLINQCGFQSSNVVVMTDDPMTKRDDFSRLPTRGNIRSRLNQISQLAGPDDTLFVFFSGHGLNVYGNGYIVPIDGHADDVSTLIPLKWVKTTIETSVAQQRILMLDACHSAAKDVSAMDTAQAMLTSLAGAAFVTMSSCDFGQLSYEDDKLKHGVFTWAAIQGLRGPADRSVQGNRDGVITAGELYAYLRYQVKRWCLRTGKTQIPVWQGVQRGPVELVRYDPHETVIEESIQKDPKPTRTRLSGKLSVRVTRPGTVTLNSGAPQSATIGESLDWTRLPVGEHRLQFRTANGSWIRTILVRQDATTSVTLPYPKNRQDARPSRQRERRRYDDPRPPVMLVNHHRQADTADPVELEIYNLVGNVRTGGHAVYSIVARNRSFAALKGLTINCVMDRSMMYVEASGATTHRRVNQNIYFEPLPNLAPLSEARWIVTVQALKPDTVAELHVSMFTAESATPLKSVEFARFD